MFFAAVELISVWPNVISREQALVRRAEDVIHTLAETVPVTERKPAEPWLDDLARLKENLFSAVQHPYQILRSVSDFHHACNRVCAALSASHAVNQWLSISKSNVWLWFSVQELVRASAWREPPAGASVDRTLWGSERERLFLWPALQLIHLETRSPDLPQEKPLSGGAGAGEAGTSLQHYNGPEPSADGHTAVSQVCPNKSLPTILLMLEHLC